MKGWDVMNEIHFANYLREIRKKKKMTMVELSKVTGVSQSYLSQLENGKSLPTDSIVSKLLSGLTDSIAEQDEIKKEMNNRILLDESSKTLSDLEAKSSQLTEGNILLSKLTSQANAISEWNGKLDTANKTVNLNNVLNYFKKNEEVQTTIEKSLSGKFLGPEVDIRKIAIELDGQPLSNEEVKALEYLVIGIQKNRNKK
ncbi:helix-turn-helix transcriptional regulator [Trichococcus sp. K1Tr]|uniref:helix-turn-helix domain-containing protein n=1 Tax=Trichococcus sp. K1Tr TaxID=3020847 RepID=UPI00232EBB33|nr:helix-turn-helix transcriptional regulator [Trichococcus sp. K1Tr]MDB6353637.1 helix-turn-helix transcriptional regulator [Trichococcus sp. K1Tr]